ncbi:MAG: ABC transporter permease subunit, partial [Bdellovibrionales bacterium]|nr:ABC transporter permease subunit [Bdellovibrionales bacterium]
MWIYLIRRLIAVLPTLFGITLIAFVIINLAPGSPIEQKLQAIRFGALQAESHGGGSGATSRGSQEVNQEVIEALKKQYGFDQPIHTRYFRWLKNLATLDFGRSFTHEEPVIDVILRKMPVSIQFGIVSFILSYLVCIPLGILKAVKNGESFDTGSSVLLFMGYSTPSFMLAILLIVLFGGGSFLDWFPINGLVSDGYENLNFFDKIADRVSHFILPLICYMIGSFTTLTVLMKNSMLEEVKRDYVRTARSKGLPEKQVLFKHALRNALIPLATGLGHFLSVFFAGALLIETIFGLDGMGWLGYSSILSRDYNVIMGLLVIESFLYLIGNIIS